MEWNEATLRPHRRVNVRSQKAEAREVDLVVNGPERQRERLQAGWNGWRLVSGAVNKSANERRGCVCRVFSGALRKRPEAELEVAELKMLTFSLAETRMDRIRSLDMDRGREGQ